jgi:uncharacterized membrane protein YhaH (DUF805 family)
MAALGFAEKSLNPPEWVKVITSVCFFVVLTAGIIIQIRRWHDRGKSGIWVFINIVPFLGGLWTIIECGFIKGTTGHNRYGPDPLDPPAQSSGGAQRHTEG